MRATGFFACVMCWFSCWAGDEGRSLTLWYEHPADARAVDAPYGWDNDAAWMSGLPMGNGSLGTVVFGDVDMERIQLNEKTMWSGSPDNGDNPAAAENLDSIRALLFKGDYREASELTRRTQVCVGAGSGRGVGSKVPFGCFQTLGDLWLEFGSRGAYTRYLRELDLTTAVGRVAYEQGGIRFERQMFVSYPDQVFVLRIKADSPRAVSLSCRLNRPERFRTYTEGGDLVMRGALDNGQGGDGLEYMARLRAVAKGGDVECSDEMLRVSQADEVLLLLSASTNYVLE